MGKEEEEPTIEELIKQLKDENEEVRDAAADFLKILRDSRAIKPLEELMKKASALDRGYLIYIIGDIGGKEAVEPLIFALTDRKYDDRILPRDFEDNFRINEELTNLRILALEYLEMIGDNRMIKPLIKIANDKKEESDLRKATIKVLAKNGDKHIIKSLRSISNDSDQKIRSLVGDVLEKLSDSSDASFRKWLRKLENGDWKESEKASKKLSKLKGWNYDRINRVINVLNEIKDVDFYYTYAPKEMLEKIADDNIIDILIQIMEERDYNVKMWIVEIFKNLKSPRIIDSLIGVIGDPKADEFTKEDAVIALANIGEPAVEPIIRTLDVNDREARYYTVLTLGWLADKRAIVPLKQRLSLEDDQYIFEEMQKVIDFLENKDS